MSGVLPQIHDRRFHGLFGIRPEGGADAGILASVEPDFLSEHFLEFRIVGPADVLYRRRGALDMDYAGSALCRPPSGAGGRLFFRQAFRAVSYRGVPRLFPRRNGQPRWSALASVEAFPPARY